MAEDHLQDTHNTTYDSTYTDTAGWHVCPVMRTAGDSGTVGSRFSWAETEARLGWSIGPLALDGVIGWRPAVDTVSKAAWIKGYATVAVSHGVALTVGAGTMTRREPFVRSAGRFGMVSLRLSPAALLRPRPVPEITPAASAFSLRMESSGNYRVSIRVPRARVVELSGDFNGWRPLRLSEVRPDVWEVVLPISAGTYRMNVRIDGERWEPPPGVPAVEDEFNGLVGLVVVH